MDATGLEARHPSALLVLAGLLACSPGATADSRFASGPDGLSAKAGVQLMIRIPKVALLGVDGAPALLSVSRQDVLRGYVEISGVRIRVVANARGGKYLSAAADPAVATSVEITGIAGGLVAGPEGKVRLSTAPRDVVDRRYDVRVRVNLAPGVGAGTYPWPLVLRVVVP